MGRGYANGAAESALSILFIVVVAGGVSLLGVRT